jgi:hypothetical protein
MALPAKVSQPDDDNILLARTPENIIKIVSKYNWVQIKADKMLSFKRTKNNVTKRLNVWIKTTNSTVTFRIQYHSNSFSKKGLSMEQFAKEIEQYEYVVESEGH